MAAALQRITALLCVVASLGWAGAVLRAGEPTPLPANTPLDSQIALLDGTARLYRLTGLRPLTSYEVRVSYPATTPATIRLRLLSSSSRVARRLLDTEKVIFRTDSAGGIPEAPAPAPPLLELRAAGRSVSREGPRGGPLALVYNIACVELVAGALPRDLLPTLGACALLAGAAWALAPRFSAVVVPRLLRWVLRG